VFKEGSVTDGIYFIKSGHFEVYKCFKGENEGGKENLKTYNNNNNFDSLSRMDSSSSLVDSKQNVKLLSLSSNDVFGETEVLLKIKTRQCNVLCVDGGELLFCSKVAFYNIVSSYTIKKMHEENMKKIEIMNNMFKIKSISISKTEESENNTTPSKKKTTKKIRVMKHVDVNFHGFAVNARTKGGYNFERQLEILLVNSYGAKDYFGGKCLLEERVEGSNLTNSSSDEMQQLPPVLKRRSQPSINLTNHSSLKDVSSLNSYSSQKHMNKCKTTQVLPKLNCRAYK